MQQGKSDQDIDIEKLAHLAKIELSSREKEVFSKHIKEIKAFFDQISEVNTEGILPLQFVHDTAIRGRVDKCHDSGLDENIRSLNPSREESDRYYIVPGFIPAKKKKI